MGEGPLLTALKVMRKSQGRGVKPDFPHMLANTTVP